MRTSLSRLAAVIFSVSAVTYASADPIVFRHESSGAGMLNGVPFSERAFTIEATADTTNRQNVLNDPRVFFIEHTAATISISGLGTFDILTPTRTFVNQPGAIAGFSHGPNGSDLVNGPRTNAFALWDMLDSVGPVEGPGSIFQWGLRPVNTSGGILFFESAASLVRFTATVDSDIDGDGVPNSRDQCPDTAANAVVDRHGCSIEQLVPCSGPRSGGRWKSHRQYYLAITQTARQFEAQGHITRRQKWAIISTAARSRCGI